MNQIDAKKLLKVDSLVALFPIGIDEDESNLSVKSTCTKIDNEIIVASSHGKILSICKVSPNKPLDLIELEFGKIITSISWTKDSILIVGVSKGSIHFVEAEGTLLFSHKLSKSSKFHFHFFFEKFELITLNYLDESSILSIDIIGSISNPSFILSLSDGSLIGIEKVPTKIICNVAKTNPTALIGATQKLIIYNCKLPITIMKSIVIASNDISNSNGFECIILTEENKLHFIEIENFPLFSIKNNILFPYNNIYDFMIISNIENENIIKHIIILTENELLLLNYQTKKIIYKFKLYNFCTKILSISIIKSDTNSLLFSYYITLEIINLIKSQNLLFIIHNNNSNNNLENEISSVDFGYIDYQFEDKLRIVPLSFINSNNKQNNLFEMNLMNLKLEFRKYKNEIYGIDLSMIGFNQIITILKGYESFDNNINSLSNNSQLLQSIESRDDLIAVIIGLALKVNNNTINEEIKTLFYNKIANNIMNMRIGINEIEFILEITLFIENPIIGCIDLLTNAAKVCILLKLFTIFIVFNEFFIDFI